MEHSNYWRGWHDRAQFLKEHHQAHSRGWIGISLMLIGSPILGWCIVVMMLVAPENIDGTRLTLLAILSGVLIFGGLIRHKFEQEAHRLKVDEFESRWRAVVDRRGRVEP